MIATNIQFLNAGTGAGRDKEPIDTAAPSDMPEIQLEDVSELRSKGGEEEVPF